MNISFSINIFLSTIVFYTMRNFVENEALFWTFTIFISLLALTFVSPDRDLTKHLQGRRANKWFIGFSIILSALVNFSAPGVVIEKIIRWFCIFISFYSFYEAGSKLLNRKEKNSAP